MFSFSAADLDVLRELDHPVLLGIDGSDGVRRIVALRQLGDGEAELDGVIESRVPCAFRSTNSPTSGSATRTWCGATSSRLPELILPGAAGDDVVWLQQRARRRGLYAVE